MRNGGAGRENKLGEVGMKEKGRVHVEQSHEQSRDDIIMSGEMH